MTSTADVGLNLDRDDFAQYAARCSALHITRLEVLPQSVARQPPPKFERELSGRGQGPERTNAGRAARHPSREKILQTGCP
jgi:hypothetical protein